MASHAADDDAIHPDLLKPIKSLSEKWKLLPAFLQARGLVQQHIESFDIFLAQDLRNIVEANAEVTCDTDSKWFLRYTNIHVASPSVHEDMADYAVTPHDCRLRDLSYSAPVYVDVEYLRGKEVVRAGPINIGRIPIMLRSSKCRLRGLSLSELEAVKECPYDPGGYFIVKGVEKVCLIQEQLSKNRIILERDAKGVVSASVTSSTHERKSRTVIALKGGRLHMQHNTIGDDVPVAVVLKALGVTSDVEICTLLGPEPALHAALSPSLEEAAALGLFTQAQALEYIGSKIKAKRAGGQRSSSVSRTDEARNVLATVVLNHVPVVRFDFRPKAQYVCHMVRRILLTAGGALEPDDKDYYGNKVRGWREGRGGCRPSTHFAHSPPPPSFSAWSSRGS